MSPPRFWGCLESEGQLKVLIVDKTGSKMGLQDGLGIFVFSCEIFMFEQFLPRGIKFNVKSIVQYN